MTTRFALPSARKAGWTVAIAALLILPALHNHYPLLYSDSGEYLLSAVTHRPPRVRLAGYGLFLFGSGGTLTAWAPIVAQSLLLAALLLRTLLAAGVALTRRTMLVVGAALLVTGAPWMSSELMPDVFAGAVVLALYLVVAHWARLGIVWRVVTVATIVLGCATHTSLPILAGALLLVLAVVRRASWAPAIDGRGLARAAGFVTLSVVALATFNWARTDRLTVTRKGSVFLLGHLVESGLAERELGVRCDVAAFALCPFRAGLTRPIDRFLWDDASPLYQAYGSEAQLRDDTRALALAVLRDQPFRLAGSVIAYGARQFVTLEVFDVARVQPANRYTSAVVDLVLPHESAALAGARQQHEGVSGLRWLDVVITAAMLVALGLAVVAVVRARRDGRLVLDGVVGLQLFLLVVLVLNALVCANLSGVFGRYQERIAWLLPVVVAAALATRRRPAPLAEVARR